MLIVVGDERQLDVSGGFWEILGIEVISASAEGTLTRMPTRPALYGAGTPALHGGALAALADCTGGLACVVTVLEGARAATLPQTAYLMLDFVATATADVVAYSSVIAHRRRSALVATEVRGQHSGDLILHATGRYVLSSADE